MGKIVCLSTSLITFCFIGLSEKVTAKDYEPLPICQCEGKDVQSQTIKKIFSICQSMYSYGKKGAAQSVFDEINLRLTQGNETVVRLGGARIETNENLACPTSDSDHKCAYYDDYVMERPVKINGPRYRASTRHIDILVCYELTSGGSK